MPPVTKCSMEGLWFRVSAKRKYEAGSVFTISDRPERVGCGTSRVLTRLLTNGLRPHKIAAKCSTIAGIDVQGYWSLHKTPEVGHIMPRKDLFWPNQ